MKNRPILENHYGVTVWVNKEMDILRKSECLCLNCKLISSCNAAKKLYQVCKDDDLALAVTRCHKFNGGSL